MEKELVEKKMYASLDATINWIDQVEHTPDGYIERMNYYLYIDSNGERSYSVLADKLITKHESWKTHHVFMKYVKPWLAGADIPYITEKALFYPEPTVCVPKYNETTIDRLYNFYCKTKKRHLRTLTSKDLNKIFEI